MRCAGSRTSPGVPAVLSESTSEVDVLGHRDASLNPWIASKSPRRHQYIAPLRPDTAMLARTKAIVVRCPANDVPARSCIHRPRTRRSRGAARPRRAPSATCDCRHRWSPGPRRSKQRRPRCAPWRCCAESLSITTAPAGAGDLAGGVGAPVGRPPPSPRRTRSTAQHGDRGEARGQVPLLVVRRHDHRHPGHAVCIVTHPSNLDADLWGVLLRGPATSAVPGW